MNRHMSLSMICLAFLLIIGMLINPSPHVLAFSPQVIQHGATGDDVIELQARLQYIGFYDGKIDGNFGWGTYWALRNFQKKFSLTVDGVAGITTKNKLVKESKYNKSYVKNQIRSGHYFTYYGNLPLSQQHSGSKSNQNTSNKKTGNKKIPEQENRRKNQ